MCVSARQHARKLVGVQVPRCSLPFSWPGSAGLRHTQCFVYLCTMSASGSGLARRHPAQHPKSGCVSVARSNTLTGMAVLVLGSGSLLVLLQHTRVVIIVVLELIRPGRQAGRRQVAQTVW